MMRVLVLDDDGSELLRYNPDVEAGDEQLFPAEADKERLVAALDATIMLLGPVSSLPVNSDT